MPRKVRTRFAGGLGRWRRAALCAVLLAAGCRDEPPSAPPVQRAESHDEAGRAEAIHGRSASGRPAEPKRPAGPIPAFREVTNGSGVDFERYDDFRGKHRIIEVNGGGVAVFDFDADSLPDLFFTDGCRFPVAEADGTRTNRLYRRRTAAGGPLRYADVTDRAGLRLEAYWHGCVAGDYDADGFDDLFVTANGSNKLWRSNGDGTFADVSDRLPGHPPAWSASAAFCDLDLDGTLDLYVATYVDESRESPRLCPRPDSPDGYLQCSPTLFDAVPDIVLFGDGEGGFRDLTEAGGFTAPDGKGLGVVVFQADDDDLPDVYVANDGTPNFLFINRTAAGPGDRSPRFTEEAFQRGAAVNEAGEAESSMGVIAGDATGDGRADLFMTHFYAQTNTFYRNLGDGQFEDDTSESGLGPPSRRMLGFGTLFLDFDQDGRQDIFVANGHIDDFSYANPDERYAMTPQVFRNDGGVFTDVSAWAGDYFRKEWLGRGAAAGDLDNDGDLDLVVSHQRAKSSVVLNETPTPNGSVQLRLVGVESNRSAYGAVVACEGLPQVVVRERVGGGGYQSSSDARLHIGLGAAGRLPKATIRWPSGHRQVLSDVPPGDHLVVEGRRPVALKIRVRPDVATAASPGR